ALYVVQDWYMRGESIEELDAALTRLEAEPSWLLSFTGSMRSAAALKNMASQLIGRFTRSASAATRAAHGEGPLSRYGGDMVVPEQTHMEIAVLKGLAAAYVMSSASQQPVYEAQVEIIRDLYSLLWNTGTQYLSPLFTELWHSASADDGRRRVGVAQIACF